MTKVGTSVTGSSGSEPEADRCDRKVQRGGSTTTTTDAVASRPQPRAQSETVWRTEDCSGDSSVSALMGTCFHGVCICQSPYNVAANGKCASIKLPDCQSQSGTCRQTPATCLGTEIETTIDPGACGDFVAAVCCGKTGRSRPPVCLNG